MSPAWEIMRRERERKGERGDLEATVSFPHYILSSSLHSWSRGPSCDSSVPVQIVLVLAQLQFPLAQPQLQRVLVEFKYTVKLQLILAQLVLALVQLLVQLQLVLVQLFVQLQLLLAQLLER